MTDDRIIEAVGRENNRGFPIATHENAPLTAALVARAEVGVCPECHCRFRQRVPSVNGGERCRHPFHDAHEAYERAKKEAGLT